ncbi:uncharacterized protein LOC126896938 [Daktulosphaira vitifoliae]|uniref:uncharacterized protein LOC126896938 n=1 Tax=Daktulosphaira vitifoliae TaxID=58002 RepID=UPI0021A97B77|nr:uncharacterized protein LOC126896938 [Daktulosphaira vitifoliae]
MDNNSYEKLINTIFTGALYTLNEAIDKEEFINKVQYNSAYEKLNERNLNTTGTLTNLKDRLRRYIRNELLESDYATISEIPSTSKQFSFCETTNLKSNKNTIYNSSPIQIQHNNNMSERVPFCKPQKFSGSIHENINTFLNKYNKAGDINGWSDEQKKSFLAIYLDETASIFLDNFDFCNSIASWSEVQQALLSEFQLVTQTHMLRTLLAKRRQLPDESLVSYLNDVQNLCKKIDPKMSQSELVHAVMKGLQPKVARYVGILDNKTLDEL